MKKILGCLLGIMTVTGCTEVSKDTEAYIEGNAEVAYTQETSLYTCDDNQFFYLNKNNNSMLNFTYENYSTNLLKKPTMKMEVFSDGLYKLAIRNNVAQVFMDNEVVLNNCKEEF